MANIEKEPAQKKQKLETEETLLEDIDGCQNEVIEIKLIHLNILIKY
jgi:hypothetical protein